MRRRRFLHFVVSLPATAFITARPDAVLAADEVIRMRDLYTRELAFSDLALANAGRRITVSGFMAPPLKADSVFFVLTKMPMSVCPFCEPTMPWPDDILAIYAKRVGDVIPFNVPITVTGVLELGDHIDPDLGFYSKVRLTDAIYTRV